MAFDCLVAVTEACTQAFDHCEAPGDDFAITWDIEPGCVRFYLQENATRESSKASHPSGGPVGAADAAADLPLELMLSLMDEVSVQQGPHGRTLALTKLLT